MDDVLPWILVHVSTDGRTFFDGVKPFITEQLKLLDMLLFKHKENSAVHENRAAETITVLDMLLFKHKENSAGHRNRREEHLDQLVTEFCSKQVCYKVSTVATPVQLSLLPLLQQHVQEIH